MMVHRASDAQPAISPFVALLILTGGGAFALAGQVIPAVGSATLLAVGIELIIWAFVAGVAGLLAAGSVLAGVGAAVVLAAGPLTGAHPQVIGAAFLFGVAA